MHYSPGLETTVLNASGDRPHFDLRIKAVDIVHNTQAGLVALEYELEVFKQNHEPVDPRPFVLPGVKIKRFPHLVRDKLAKVSLLYPQEGPIGSVCPGSLPNVIIGDFLGRVMHPQYKYVPMNFPLRGIGDPKWQNDILASGELDHLNFLPRYMQARYEYDAETEALTWKNGRLHYVCMSNPEGTVTTELDYAGYVAYVLSDKMVPVRLSVNG